MVPADVAVAVEKPLQATAVSAELPASRPVEATAVASLPGPIVEPTPVASQPADQGASLTPPEAQSQPQSRSDNIVATQRMYLAHASLRAPEVADPDSAGNRQILQTMLAKALARPEASRPLPTGSR